MNESERDNIRVGTDSGTVDVYNKSAQALREKYMDMGARTEDVERGLSLCGKENPFVLEIGFGSGREAEVIKKFTDNYVGIDVSSGMVSLASERNPELNFIEADVMAYDLPRNLDVVFAFASLLHLSKEQLKKVFNEISQSLAEGGIFYISLKREEEYSNKIVGDEFGSRHFYYYSHEDVSDLAPSSLEEVYYDEQHFANKDWFTIAFKKI